MLRNRLCEKFPDIEKADIDKAVELYDKAYLKGCLLYAPSESDKLWSYTNVGEFLIILVNTNHLFFEKMIKPLQDAGAESALSAVELFLSSLAYEEFTQFSKGKNSRIIEEFRSYVGLHLNRYLADFDFTDEFRNEK